MQTKKILTSKIFGYILTKLCCNSLPNPLLVPLAKASTTVDSSACETPAGFLSFLTHEKLG